jgi:hypothetical protein
MRAAAAREGNIMRRRRDGPTDLALRPPPPPRRRSLLAARVPRHMGASATCLPPSPRGRYPTSGFAFSNRPGAGRRASGVSRAAPPHHCRIHRLVRSWSRSVFVLKKITCFNFFHRSCSATQPPESAYTSAFDVCSARRES